jgi:hypothetical protein
MTLWQLASLVIPKLLDENFKSRWPEAHEILNNSKLGPSAFPTDDLPPDLIRDALAFWPYHYVLRSGRLEALYDGPTINEFASGTVSDCERAKLPPNSLSAIGVFDRFGAEAIYTAHEKAVWGARTCARRKH